MNEWLKKLVKQRFNIFRFHTYMKFRKMFYETEIRECDKSV
jgi:hypothetical protein